MHKVTNSAFTQARSKLKHTAFIELDKMQIEEFYKNISYKTWNGFRLVSIDGSTLRLPYTKETAEKFGIQTERSVGSPVIKARISESFDPLNHITLDAQIHPYIVSEHQMLIDHIRGLKKGDLAILDRNYPAFWVYKLFMKYGIEFCIRVQLTGTKIIELFVESGEKEKIVEFTCPNSSIKKCVELGLDQEPIKCRLVRVELDNGSIEILITSLLNTEIFPNNIFKELYNLRWPVEEDYKLLKYRIELENFSGKSEEAIYQDYFAKIFTTNLASILAFESSQALQTKTDQGKSEYKLNWSNVINKMKNSGFLLFVRTEFEIILKKLYELFMVNPIPVRTGRSSNRIHRKRKRIYSFCYK